MLPTHKLRAIFTGLLTLLAMLTTAPASADAVGDACRQWGVPPTLLMTQGHQRLTFKLQEEGTNFHGWAYYETSKGWVKGNVSGSVANNTFYARVLWTYSGVNAIGRYSGKITPRVGVPADAITYGTVNEGYTYDEYDTSNYAYWSATHFLCKDVAPTPPAAAPPNPAERARDHSAATDVFKTAQANEASQVAESDQGIASATALAPTVKAQARVKLDGATGTSNLTICEAAAGARARSSPAAPGLEARCALQTSLGVPALAAKGEAIATQDSLAGELRDQQVDEAARRGFDIGLGASEGQTLWGPGKQQIMDSLATSEQQGFAIAAYYTVDRNRNAKLAAAGHAIASADPALAQARSVEADGRYGLGFDIATALFGDSKLGAEGNTSTGPGSLGIRDALSAPAQRGFDAAVEILLSRDH